MTSPYRLLASASVFLLGMALTQGCPKHASSHLRVSPESLDFGRSTRELTLSVAPTDKLTAPTKVMVTASTPWIQITPTSPISSGPGYPAKFQVSINRAQMRLSGNSGQLYVTTDAPGNVAVAVRADAMLITDFTFSPATPYVGDSIVFSESSKSVSGIGPIEAREWSFGDGSSASEQNPVHIYRGPGRYSVKLTVRTKDFEDTKACENCVDVRVPESPKAAFAAATSKPVAFQPLLFTDLSWEGSSSISEWLWDFGDGCISFLRNPVHCYTAAAVYDVFLRVKSARGEDSEVKLGCVDVQEAPPTPVFYSVPASSPVNRPVSFVDVSRQGSKSILGWLWDFGDGDVSVLRNSSHVFAAAAQYTVSLTINTESGSATSKQLIMITPVMD